MSDRTFTINLDKWLQIIEKAGPHLPSLLETATAAGVPIPSFVMSGLPMLGKLSAMVDDIAGPRDDGQSGLSKTNIDTGPLGRGRTLYLRRKSAWSDEKVCRAAEMILSPEVGLKSAREVIRIINYTSSCMFPGTADFSDQQTRQAIDRMLESEDGIPQGMCDKFGDHLYLVLTKGLSEVTVEGSVSEPTG